MPETRRSSPISDRTSPCRPPTVSSRRLARSSASLPREPLPSTSASSSLSPSAAALMRASFSRGRSCGATSFIYTQIPMRHWSPCATAAAGCLAMLLVTACAAPPNREIADAQQALAAAKAAGAERYASDTYRAATEAYRLANEAVGTGDYRLALNRALESRDHAQRASRTAED